MKMLMNFTFYYFICFYLYITLRKSSISRYSLKNKKTALEQKNYKFVYAFVWAFYIFNFCLKSGIDNELLCYDVGFKI